jgi:LPXTG-motif cell wall-anchored protein
VNRTSLMRRLLIGAAGVTLGVAATLAGASPASAHAPSVVGTAVCENGEWVVTWTVTSTNHGGNTEWKLNSATPTPTEPALSGITLDTFQSVDSPFVGTQRLPGTATSASLEVGAEWKETHHTGSDSADLTFEGTCDGGEEPPPDLTDTVFAGVTCDFLIVFVFNDDIEEGVSITITPNEDTVHGDAPDFIEFGEQIREGDEGEIFDIPPDAGLEDTEDVAGGETLGPIGPFAPGERHAHGFEAFEGFEVEVAIFLGDSEEPAEVFTSAWDDEGLGCEESPSPEPPGEGGGLPDTGAPTMLIVAGAGAMLLLGTGLFLMARRRRVTFTS